VIITLEFDVKPGMAQQAAELASQTLASARDWEGCLGIHVAFAADTDTFVVIEHWASDGQAENYRAWRRATNPPNPLVESGLTIGDPARRVFDEPATDAAPTATSKANRLVVERFLASFAAGDTDAMVGHLADGATYWVAGTKHGTGVAIPKETFADMHRGAADIYVDRRLEVVPTGWTVEGERVAVEANGFAELKNGRRYDNHYHFLCIVRDGKIVEVREYNDTDYMFTVLMG
jgi:ketosteroid isomerase-like protein/quinol monooxygenase YgiN